MSTQFIPIKKLVVNSNNPRFEPVKNEKQAILLMLKEVGPKILKLAEDIARHGLNPSKKLMVSMLAGGMFIPHEGNRRVAAMKILQDPSFSKGTIFYDSFLDLNKKYKTSIPREIECSVFPDAEAASRWVKLEHTGENNGVGVVRWDATQIQRFDAQYTNKISKTLQVLDFIEDNGISTENVDPTTLERLVSTAHVREKIGIDFEKGSLVFKEAKASVARKLARVVGEMKKPTFSVGKVYKKEDRVSFIDGVISGTAPKATLTSVDASGKVRRSVPNNQDRKTLIPKGCTLKIKDTRINSIYYELKDLPVVDFKNATAVLFRVFIEFVFDDYLTKFKSELSAKPGEQLELNKKVIKVADYLEKNGDLTKNQLKSLRLSAGSQHSIISTNTFNAYIHNLSLNPDSDSLKIAWNNLQVAIEKITDLTYAKK
jgi:hypothetical protein